MNSLHEMVSNNIYHAHNLVRGESCPSAIGSVYSYFTREIDQVTGKRNFFKMYIFAADLSILLEQTKSL